MIGAGVQFPRALFLGLPSTGVERPHELLTVRRET